MKGIFIRKVMSDGWTIEELYQPDTGLKNRYYYLGKRAPAVAMNDKMSKKYAAYSLIEKDLRSTIVWLEEIIKINPDQTHRVTNPEQMNLVKGLLVAALTFYGKCFTACEGRRIKLEKTIIPQEHQELHDDLLLMRHNFAAHGGVGFEAAKVSLALHPDIMSDMEPQLYTELVQPDCFDEIPEFLTLVKKLQVIALQKRKAIGEKVMSDVVWPKGKLFWYTQSKYE